MRALLLSVCLFAAGAVAAKAQEMVSLLDAQKEAARALADAVEAGVAGNGCAVIGIGPRGYLQVTALNQANCLALAPEGWEVTAFVSTTPTSAPEDGALAAAVAAGQDRYVITPSGQLWFLDAFAAQQSLLCGPGCGR